MTRASFPTRGPWKILVVDDERDALDEIRPLIEADGDTCYTAESAEEAFARLESDPSISIVITDVRMPGIDGLEFVRRVSARQMSVVGPQFIVISGHASIDSVQAAIRLKVHDFLRKPISLSDLRKTIASAKQTVASEVLDRSVSESIATELETQSRLASELQDALKRVKGRPAARPEGPFGQIAQRDFASVLGRELRSALVPILGVARLMRQAETASVETVNGYGEVIHTEATKAAEILDTILDYYAAESGAIQLNHAQANVGNLVQRVVEVFRQIADAHGIHLRVDFPSDLPDIVCDPQRISQAFAHLLSNAIRFSGTQGRVEVSVEVRHAIVEIRVADRGGGLSPEETKLAFLPFKRDVKAGAKPQQGIGLGLTIASRFAKLHGGAVRLEPRLGGGTNAYLTFPAYSRTSNGAATGSSAPEKALI